MQSLDFAAFTYHPITFDGAFEVYEPTVARVRADLDALTAAAGGKLLVLQEAGCPAGYEPSTTGLGASALRQQQFVIRIGAELASRPRLRAVFISQLVDWSSAVIRLVYKDLLAQGSATFGERFIEWLSTTGLISYEAGTERPAWKAFIQGITNL